MGPRNHKWTISPLQVLRDTDLASKPQRCPVGGEKPAMPAMRGFIVKRGMERQTGGKVLEN